MSKEILSITGSGSELQGVGRLSDGRAAFVPFAIPGETVEIEITDVRDRFANARLLRVIEPSPDRIAPACKYFGVCGGCQAQHIRYERALLLKRERVYDALTRLGGLKGPEVLPTVPSEAVFAYRNKAEYAFLGKYAGQFAAKSHSVVDMDACPLQTEDANRVFRFIKENKGALPIKYAVPRVNGKGEMLVTLSIDRPAELSPLAQKIAKAFPFVTGVFACTLKNRPAHALDGSVKKLCGSGEFMETLLGLSFRVSPRSFFQVNRRQTEKLYETALRLAALSPNDNVADVYCGAGTISLAAARLAGRVTGIEIVEDAVKDAVQNAQRNGLSAKARFIAGDAAKEYLKICKKEAFDVVIVDPPRKGVDEPVINALLSAPPKRIVYVSCNPATLARDIKLLTANGTFKFEKAIPVDMFPQTGHVETVCLLSKLRTKEHIDIELTMDKLDATDPA